MASKSQPVLPTIETRATITITWVCFTLCIGILTGGESFLSYLPD